jgi:hypothetical protein
MFGGKRTNSASFFPSATRKALLLAAVIAGLAGGPTMAVEPSELPQPPCQAEAPVPAFPATNTAPAVVQSWQASENAVRWTPPPCTGWEQGGEHGYRTMVALSGRIDLPAGQGSTELLRRLGAVSSTKEARYWSVTDQAWKPLVTDTSALNSADPRQKRADFGATDLAAKRDVFFVQYDDRATNGVVYRMQVRESGPDRLVVETENVTGIRLLLVTLFQPRSVQTVHYFQRLSPNSWGYYSLSRTTEAGSSSAVDGHAASYVNRAAAYYRLMAGVPTDRDPPMAP